MIDKLKSNLLAIIAFFSAIIGGLIFFIYRKDRENGQLKADKSLTKQEERSKIVDEKVSSAQVEIDKLSQEMNKPVKSDDDFWKDYTKGKK
jgi:hypothetical protein